jgi:hypothetical protein
MGKVGLTYPVDGQENAMGETYTFEANVED